MTSIELCRTSGLTERELSNWLDYGLVGSDTDYQTNVVSYLGAIPSVGGTRLGTRQP
jgi:hypothetical protein